MYCTKYYTRSELRVLLRFFKIFYYTYILSMFNYRQILPIQFLYIIIYKIDKK